VELLAPPPQPQNIKEKAHTTAVFTVDPFILAPNEERDFDVPQAMRVAHFNNDLFQFF
jgi:hypothetical protein